MEFTFAFLREFDRSTESKRTLTPCTTEILKSIVLPNTILSFSTGLIYCLIVGNVRAGLISLYVSFGTINSSNESLSPKSEV